MTGETLPADLDEYNSELERFKSEGKGTWFGVSWLFGECYMVSHCLSRNSTDREQYRRLRILFAESKHWTDFDPFQRQKASRQLTFP